MYGIVGCGFSGVGLWKYRLWMYVCVMDVGVRVCELRKMREFVKIVSEVSGRK